MPRIVMVKKRLENGEPCAKCAQAEELLRKRGVWDRVSEVIWADERDPESPGMQLARKHDVKLAPFFLVSQENGATSVVTSTLAMAKTLAAVGTDAVDSTPLPATPSQNEIAETCRSLAERSPADVLAWGLERFGQHLSIAFSGAEDVVLIDMAARRELPFRVFCLDTGRLHEETYRFVDRVRGFYGVDVQLYSPETETLQAFVRKKGLFSFFEDGHAECCGVRKVEPLKRALSTSLAWATGQRREQSPATRDGIEVIELDAQFRGLGGRRLVKLNPLAHWSSAQVWEYLRGQRVPYNELHDHGFASIGCQPCTRPARPGEPERAARWWWEEATQRECGLHVERSGS